MALHLDRPDRAPGADTAGARHVRRAWYQYDWASSAYPSPVLSVFLALYLTGVAEAAAQASGQPCADGTALVGCDVSLWGFVFPAGSLWGYLLVVGTCVQLLVMPLVGLVADRTGRWAAVLTVCVVLGAGGTAGLALAGGTAWLLGSVMFIVANAGFGAGQVVYNSYLPSVASPEQRDVVTSRGTGLGFVGAGIVLVLQLVVYLGHDGFGLDEGQAVRLCFLLSGLWWAVFAIRPLLALRRLDPVHRPERAGSRPASVTEALTAVVRFPLTLWFLGAFLLFVTGINTINTVAAQYGEREIGIDQDVLVPTLVAIQFVGAAGAILHGWLAQRIGTRSAILVSLGCWCVLIGVGYFVPRGAVVGFVALSCAFGVLIGGTIALSRSLFSKMVPVGREAQFFSLYSVVERAGFLLGPLAFAGVAQVSGSYRPAMMSMLVFFVAGAVVLALLPVGRATAAARGAAPRAATAELASPGR